MTTYRERRERRAERLREWAEKRETKAETAHAGASSVADRIPFGQPILVGHHSEGRMRRDIDRIDRGHRQGFEHQAKADSMNSRATNIEAQLDASIYDDDPDAVEKLRERLAGLEAERDRIKAYNASCRRGQPDDSLLDERQRRNLEKVRQHTPYSLGKKGEMPGYALTNLSGNINRQKQRLARLERAQDATPGP